VVSKGLLFMSKIRILPEIISNKIAAGEVVERPASVVKELMENSLDAGGTHIRVDVESGGRSLIRVADNGSGMNRDDALLALERYATSKIYNDADLFAIATLGFRGEALPSIASVSRFELVTREADADAGTGITVDGGKIKSVAAVGAPTGTMITVRQLFFNTPARRKFLKTVNTEMGHVGDTVSRIAMGHPAVRITLNHNGRNVKDWPAVSDGAIRVADVLGNEAAADLLRIDLESENVSLTGWCLAGHQSRATSRGIYTYVNGRFVRDRVVQHAVMEGYSGRLMKRQYPVAVLFIRVPPDRVDVNVHPTKHEIRFADQRQVHDHIVRSVMTALRQGDPGGRMANQYETRRPSPVVDAQLREKIRPYASAEQRTIWRSATAEKNTISAPSSMTRTPVDLIGEERTDAETPIKPDFAFDDLKVIGQYKGTYILCECRAGLVIIDQHAAHERVVYEALIQESRREQPASQRLLMPETVEVGFREADLLDKLVPAFQRIGFEVAPFGGNTWAITAVPSLLTGVNAAIVIQGLIENALADGQAHSPERLLEPMVQRIACHDAIRANHPLSVKEMETLLRQLADCANPSHCPHGRPLWLIWTPRDLEKAFKRIV
jgi:DNA mismatch repair protein MutL